VRAPGHAIGFADRIQGRVSFNLKDQSGDYVIRRADGYFAYQLAVAVDDAFQQITDIVRGADLMDSTPRQIWLQHCLKLPTPNYAHIPVVTQQDGQKLSKRFLSDPVSSSNPLLSLRLALQFLGHQPPVLSWQKTWDWALDNWSLKRVPRCRTQVFPGQD
jgi:glutamyl-Q tRNA(Asp) synthetase